MKMLASFALMVFAMASSGLPAQAPKAFKVSFINSAGQDAGTAKISAGKGGVGVKIKIELKNIPFGPHAVHVHEHAACTPPDFEDAGAHFNPTRKHHGFANPDGHHAGDTPGNIDIGEDHTGEVTFTLPALSLDPAASNSIFANGGTAIVVHEHGDDQHSDPSGNSGNRIACAIIKQP
jgi:Cu-Zn family superoxide dismutase